MTVVVITHNSAISAIADRIITVRNSKIADVTINKTPADADKIEW